MGDDTAARMGKGQNEGGFSEEQLQMYKDCFKLMDINKDGQLDKNDLRGAFDNVGVLFGEFEIDEDYMIKTKDVIGLFVAVKEEPKVEEPAPVEEAPEAEPEEEPTPRRRRRRRRRPPSKLAPFST